MASRISKQSTSTYRSGGRAGRPDSTRVSRNDRSEADYRWRELFSQDTRSHQWHGRGRRCRVHRRLADESTDGSARQHDCAAHFSKLHRQLACREGRARCRCAPGAQWNAGPVLGASSLDRIPSITQRLCVRSSRRDPAHRRSPSASCSTGRARIKPGVSTKKRWSSGAARRSLRSLAAWISTPIFSTSLPTTKSPSLTVKGVAAGAGTISGSSSKAKRRNAFCTTSAADGTKRALCRRSYTSGSPETIRKIPAFQSCADPAAPDVVPLDPAAPDGNSQSVQVLRSRFKWKIPNCCGSGGTAWAGLPDELATGGFLEVYNTMKKAIAAATRYIYVEDQFLMDSPPGGYVGDFAPLGGNVPILLDGWMA